LTTRWSRTGVLASWPRSLDCLCTRRWTRALQWSGATCCNSVDPAAWTTSSLCHLFASRRTHTHARAQVHVCVRGVRPVGRPGHRPADRVLHFQPLQARAGACVVCVCVCVVCCAGAFCVGSTQPNWLRGCGCHEWPCCVCDGSVCGALCVWWSTRRPGMWRAATLLVHVCTSGHGDARTCTSMNVARACGGSLLCLHHCVF
jgi:hypothetical protein